MHAIMRKIKDMQNTLLILKKKEKVVIHKS